MYFAETEFKVFALLSIYFAHAYGNLGWDKCVMRDPDAHWIDQPVNHFDTKDTRTWKMKYLTYNDYFKPNGSIIIELMKGMVIPCYKLTEDFANETNAVVIQPEFRYNGEIIPSNVTPDSTMDDFKFLSARQHLADLANLLEVLKQAPEYRSSKVVAIGNLDAGNMAVWLRMLYPDLVDAAVAGSAPLLAKVDVDQYLVKIGNSYKKYGYPGCYENITKKNKRYDDLLKTSNGTAQLVKEENICNDTDMSTLESRALFYKYKMWRLTISAEYGGPMSIKLRCFFYYPSILETETILWNKNEPCVSFNFENKVKWYKHFPQRFAEQFERCAEYGQFVTTTSDNQIFGKHIPIEYFYKLCTAMFGPECNEQRVKQGVDETNKLFGGLRPNVTNVVFVNGDMDPYNTLEVVKDLFPNAPAIVLPDLPGYGFLSFPPSSTKKVQKHVRELVKKWIGFTNS